MCWVAIPEQAEEEQGAELGDDAGLGSVTLGGGRELAKAIVLAVDETGCHRADLVHGLFALARVDDGERGGGIALLPDAHGPRQLVEPGGDQAVEEFAIGDVGRRLADRRLYARDLREGCVVFVQIAGIAGQQVSSLSGFRGGEFGKQFLGLFDDGAGPLRAIGCVAKGPAVQEGVNGDPDHDDHGNRQPQIVGRSRHRGPGFSLIPRVSAGHHRLKGFAAIGFDPTVF